MSLSGWLKIKNAHTVALIGGGGKTTLLWLLAQEWRAQGQRVLVTTSTRIYLPKAGQCDRFISPEKALTALADRREGAHTEPGVVCVGMPAPRGKCTGPGAHQFVALAGGYDRVVYEADGAKRLPIKLHNLAEPVLYPGTDAVVCVLGLSALGQPVREICHRYALSEEFARWPERKISPDDFVYLAREAFAAAEWPSHFVLLLNQADALPDPALREALCQKLTEAGFFTRIGSLQKEAPYLEECPRPVPQNRQSEEDFPALYDQTFPEILAEREIK